MVNEVTFFDSIFQIEDDDPIFPLSFDTISEHQTQDVILQELITKNTNYTTKIVGNQTLIYFKDRIVVPRTLQKLILEWYHTNLVHPGETRTIHTIGQHVTWSTLQTDVHKFVSTCPRCQHYKK
jgi:Integrase zinc binding domain